MNEAGRSCNEKSGGAICEIVNHGGHRGTRRKTAESLRLCGFPETTCASPECVLDPGEAGYLSSYVVVSVRVRQDAHHLVEVRDLKILDRAIVTRVLPGSISDGS